MEVQGSSALWDVFHPRTGGLGDRVAVSAPGVELTFAELWKEADRLASGFAGAGLREGAVAGLMLPNSPLFPAALLALWRLDAAVALLSPQYGPGELDAIVEGIEPACIVRDVAATPELRPDARPNEPGAALLKFSSGSTAEPKGIALSAANVLAEVENVTGTLGLREGDRVLAGVPLFHSYGMGCQAVLSDVPDDRFGKRSECWGHHAGQDAVGPSQPAGVLVAVLKLGIQPPSTGQQTV